MSATIEPCQATCSSQDTPLPTSQASLSRKRKAAHHLPPVTLATRPNPPPDTDPSPLPPLSCQDSDKDSKRARVEVNCVFHEVDASESHHSPKQSTAWPSINNAVVCGYQLVGAGNELTAFHKPTNTVRTCQLIDQQQYLKLLQLRQRLNEAHKYWKYNDLEQMKEFVLPSSTEVCEDQTGRRLMFSPWQYGSLQARVQTCCRLPELEVHPLFRQILRGVAFCHAIGVVLRDLKLRKFIFTDQAKSRLRLHDVFDVFVCNDVLHDGVRDRHSCPAYVAPEILVRGPAEYQGRPADMWALGVLLYLLLYGRYPFNDATPQRLFSRILKARFCIPLGSNVSCAARALIYGMLRKEPGERPTAQQLWRMPWVSTGVERLSKQLHLYPNAVMCNDMESQSSVVTTQRSASRRLFTPQTNPQLVPDVHTAQRLTDRLAETISINILSATVIQEAWRDLASEGLMAAQLSSRL